MRITTYKTYLEDNINILVKEKSTNYSALSDISSPAKVVEIMNNVFDLNKLAEESLYLICLNAKCIPLGFFIVSHGTVNSSLASTRSIFNRAMLIGAVTIILVHNHPSSICTPSNQDIQITKKVQEAGELLDITLSDHIIVGGDNYFSFKESGLIDI